MTETLEKTVAIMNKKLSTLLQDSKKESITWVKASVITSLTGWNCEKMRNARINGYVKFKMVPKGENDKRDKFLYNLESVSPLLHKSSQQ